MTYRFWMTAAYAGTALALAQPATAQVWEDVTTNAIAKTSSSGSLDWARKIKTDTEGLKFVLNQAPHERLGVSSTTIDLPLPDGGTATFSVANSPIFAQGFNQNRTDIQTFKVVDTANSSNTGRLDITPLGFHAMFMHDGGRVFIDPADTKGTYHSYYDGDYAVKEGSDTTDGATCTAHDHGSDNLFTPLNQKSSGFGVSEKISFGNNLRRYRMAVAATGEYTQYFGGTKAEGQAAIVTAINRLNVIFESEMAVRMELVANNEDVVFTDPDTDPYTTSDRAGMLDENRTTLNAEIGEANFDIGHVFGVFGGGIAQLSAVCRGGKARGVSGTSRPERSSFIRLLAHEIGHQFNAPHSFNGSTGSCADARSGSNAVEPHSGSTIMSYGGICGSENLAGGKDTFFHNASLTRMNDYVENASSGGSCANLTAISNIAPVIDAGADGFIPASTPFTLNGQASDADGDDMTHIWEQVDVGPANADRDDFADDGQRPLFRSFQPASTTSRTFPQLARVLAGDRVLGEVLPTTDRDLTFRMTSRDGQGGVTDDERIIKVSAAAGPFIMETPPGLPLAGGMPHTLTWDVANTTADPINCSAVRLSLSTDGGQTFPDILVASTNNDGAASVDLPNMATTSARLRAECTSQPFFAINDANFTITQSIIVNDPPVANNDAVSVEEDSLRTQINVLANDSDPEGDTLTVVSVGSLSGAGTADLSGTGVEYSPEPGFVGTETFEYVIDDGNSNTATGTVTVTVTPKPNVAPTAADDSLTVDEDSSATRIDVLANDTDADGDTLTIQSVGTPSNGGTATIDAGQIAYTPAAGVSGTETFTYVVSDGQGGTDTGTVTVTITAAPPPPTTPPATPPPAPSATSGGGGGSFGPVLLLLLAIRNGLARRRQRKDTGIV